MANALALNNVAWLMAQQKKPGALPLAEKANKLMPDQPALMDTLAYVLALVFLLFRPQGLFGEKIIDRV